MFSRLFGKKNQAQNNASTEQQPQQNAQDKATEAMVDIKKQITKLEKQYVIDICLHFKGGAKEEDE